MDHKTEILYQYPYPIAVTYLNADNAREAMAAHDQRVRLFEVTLKFLASIAIAQYLHDRMDDARVKETLRGLVRPSLGQWNGFLREILTAYERAGRERDVVVGDLFDAYNQRRQDRPAIAQAYNEIINLVQDRSNSASTSVSLRQFCDAMINYRNKTIGHGVINRYQCERMNEPLFAAMEEMLVQLGFLKEHRLVYVEQVRVRRGSYAHEMMSFMGSTPPARMKEAYVTDRAEEYRVEEQLYLCSRGENVPVLSLHPLVISWHGDILFLNESEQERGIEYLSYTSGQIKKPDRLLEDFKEVLGFVLGDEPASASFDSLRRQASVPDVARRALYERGCEAADKQEWERAIQLLDQVQEDDEHYAEAQLRLQEVRRNKELEDLYNEVQGRIASRQWVEAETVLNDLQQASPGYRDVGALLETVRVELAQEQSLERLYTYAQEALKKRQWVRAFELLRRLSELRPDYRDVQALFIRQQRLRDLYDQSLEALSARRWADAQSTLRQIEALEPGYRDLPSLLGKAEQGMDLEAQLAGWYGQARSHMALGEWEQALQLLDRIEDRFQGYKDVPSLLAQVQAQITVACPRCGEQVPSGHQFCGKCGAPIQFWVCWRCRTPVPKARKFCGTCGAPRERDAEGVCPRCGYPNAANRRFCGHCGATLGRG